MHVAIPPDDGGDTPSGLTNLILVPRSAHGRSFPPRSMYMPQIPSPHYGDALWIAMGIVELPHIGLVKV